MKRILPGHILAIFLFFLFIFPVSANAQKGDDSDNQPDIRVGIWSNQPNILVSADANFKVVDSDTRKVLGKFDGKQKVTIAVKEANLTVNGTAVAASKLSVLAADGIDSAIEVNRRHYRGEIEIHRTNGKQGLTVVNILPVEQYLYGVIAKEISPDWPLETVKAQAVAARTFALYSLNKYKDDGYDVSAGNDCQVYGGKEGEALRTSQAVDATRGQVILYRGKPVQAFYHSSSGGYTENSENVWGTYFPYLRAVEDFDQKTPNFSWEKNWTPAQLSEALARAGYNIGNLQSIELSPFKSQPVNTFDRGVSGRVKMIQFAGDKGHIQLTGNKLRSILNLNSTLFDIKVIVPVQKSIEFEITDNAGDRESKTVEINVPPGQEKGFLGREDIHHITVKANESIVFNGFGWGHGLGMSQWGAKVMAEKGPQGDTAYFKEILKHYYQGVDIQRIY